MSWKTSALVVPIPEGARSGGIWGRGVPLSVVLVKEY